MWWFELGPNGFVECLQMHASKRPSKGASQVCRGMSVGQCERRERESGGWEGGGPSTQARAFKNTHMDGRGEGRGSSSQLPAALATPCICNIEGWINWVPNALGVINLAPCITCNSSLNPSYVWMYPFAFSMLQYVHLCPETPTLTCIWTRWISEMTGCISKLQQNQTPHHFRWI